MNKEIKRKIIVSTIAVILGVAILVASFIFRNVFTEDKISYVTGFSSGLIVVGMIILIRTMFALSGADKGRQLEYELKDERLIAINNEATNITFRITTIVAAIASIVLNLIGHETEAMIAAAFVGISTAIYLVVYFVLSRVR